jgi:hypothetical protein
LDRAGQLFDEPVDFPLVVYYRVPQKPFFKASLKCNPVHLLVVAAEQLVLKGHLTRGVYQDRYCPHTRRK